MTHVDLLKEYERRLSGTDETSQKQLKDIKNFMGSWERYCISRGEDHLLKRIPVNKNTGKMLDLYRLYAAMTSRGGSSKCVKDKKIRQVTSYMGFDPNDSEAANTLKILYRKYLYAFEQKAMFGRDIPIQRNERKSKTIRIEQPTRIVSVDLTSKGSITTSNENNFQEIYSALISSQHERNLWALKSLLRISALQECGGQPISISGSARKTPLPVYSKLPYLSFAERPEFLDILVSSPYLESLVVASFNVTTTSTNNKNIDDDFDESCCPPTMRVQTASQMLTLQILKILKNLTYDVQNQKIAAKHVSLVRVLINILLKSHQNIMIEASLAVLANISHHIALVAQTLLETEKSSTVVPTPLAAIIPFYGLVPATADDDDNGDDDDDDNDEQKEKRGDKRAVRLQRVLDMFISRLLELIQESSSQHRRVHVLYALICLSGLTRQKHNSDRVVRNLCSIDISRLVQLLSVSNTKRYTKVYRSNRRSGLILDPNLSVDTELRDVALQCIYYIVDASDEMKRLFCAEPECLRVVLSICNEDSHQGLSCAVATSIVVSLSLLKENCKKYFGPDERRQILIAASSGSSISRTMADMLLDCFPDDDDDDDDDDDKHIEEDSKDDKSYEYMDENDARVRKRPRLEGDR